MKVEAPDFAHTYGYGTTELEACLRQWLAISLFTERQISSGRAAELLGISKTAFLDLLDKHGVAYFDMTEEEFSEELAALNRLPQPPSNAS